MPSHTQISKNRESLSEFDLEYAQMLLDWGRSLDDGYIALELYEALWRQERKKRVK